MVRDELIPQVEREYPVSKGRAGRAIAGLSMGGAQSLYIGLNHPERFGCADVSDLPWTEIDFDYDLARARDEIMPRVEESAHA